MKNSRRSHLITFLIGTILIFIAVGMRSYGYSSSDYVLYAGLALHAIFWVWSLIIVINANDLKPFQKRFWLIIVVTVPVLAGLLFHFLHNRRNRITT